jgi:hypothetical protein
MKFILRFICPALIVLIAGGTLLTATGCGGDADSTPIHGEEITFRFEVTDKEELTTGWDITTTETMLDAALLGEGLVEGTLGEYGLFVSTVNGVTIEEDNAYWELQIDGEMSMLGVSSVEIDSSRTYAFVYSTF